MEDLFDTIMATERMNEPHNDFEQVKKRLKTDREAGAWIANSFLR